MLVEIKTPRIRDAAAKLPQPNAEGKLEKHDSAIDAGIRKSAESHFVGNQTVIGTSQMLARIDALLGPEVSAETPTDDKPSEPAKPAAKVDTPKPAEVKPTKPAE